MFLRMLHYKKEHNNNLFHKNADSLYIIILGNFGFDMCVNHWAPDTREKTKDEKKVIRNSYQEDDDAKFTFLKINSFFKIYFSKDLNRFISVKLVRGR